METTKDLNTPEEILNHIPQVKLDQEGRFKYILIEAEFPEENKTVEFVRGYKSCPYHADILNKFKSEEFDVSGLTLKGKPISETAEVSCPGGGRIINETALQKLAIYGYSVGFGQADHNHVVEILKKFLPYPSENFKVSFEGY